MRFIQQADDARVSCEPSGRESEDLMRQLFRALALAGMLVGRLGESIASGQMPVGTAFTYQGLLRDGGSATSGTYDFQFRLYDAAGGSGQVGAGVCADNVSVSNGVFTAPLDFGAVFGSAARFLEIDVRADTGLDCSMGAGFTTLGPRQAITPAPVATHALRANGLDAPDGSPTNALYVDNAGFVGIGTTSPQGPLDVRSVGGSYFRMDAVFGDLHANGGSDGFWGINNDGISTGRTEFIANGVVNLSIGNNGSIGMGVLPVAGTRLKAAGTIEADEFRFAADKTIYVSVDSAAFTPTVGASVGDTGEGRYASGTGSIAASVSLPDGMVITEVRWFARDVSGGSNINLILQRIPRPYSSGDSTLFVAQSFTSGTPGVTTLTNSGVNHTVNNNNATYKVSALPAVSGTSWDSGAIGIQGATIVGTVRNPR